MKALGIPTTSEFQGLLCYFSAILTYLPLFSPISLPFVGTPVGAPIPTVKVATNSPLAEKKKNWIDFNAGTVAEWESLDDCGERLLDYVLEVANGQKTHNERRGAREISIFKDGVVL